MAESVDGKMPRLLPFFGTGDQVFHLTSITEIWTISRSGEQLDGDFFGRLRYLKPLLLQLQIKNLLKLSVVEIVELKCRVDWETSREARIGVCQHL